MLKKTLDTAACILSLLILLISFGCEKDELLIPANTTNENQGMLKSSAVTGIYPEGMVSYWKFDEGSGLTAFDVAGDKDGTISMPTWITGQVNGALGFVGGGFNGVTMENSPTDLNALSMEMWMYPTSTKRWQMMFGRQTLPNHEYVYDMICNYGNSWQVRLNTGPGTWDRIYVGGGAIKFNDWSHVAFTWDGQKIKTYTNGEFRYSSSYSGTIRGGDNIPMYIGGNIPWSPNHEDFEGKIDEVAIYNRALTACEVNQHYQNGLDGLGYELVQATIDIDPNTLNLKSKAKMVTAYIELPEGYDVTEIDINTVYLEGSIPAKLHPVEVGDYDDDKIPDLMVKFDWKALIECLDGATGEITLTIKSGIDECPFFEGSDVITVINP